MVIIDTFYQLIERETSKVSGYWKVFHVIGYVVASVTGFTSTIWFYELLDSFSMNCILYPDIKFRPIKPKNPNFNKLPQNMTIDPVTTIWSSDIVCQYCLAVWMISFVGGAICATFFIVHPKGGAGYSHFMFSQPWKMICPMIIVTVLMVILSSVAVLNAANGINEFCAAFQNYTGNASCTDTIDLYSLEYHKKPHPVNIRRTLTKASSSISFIAWVYSLSLLILRICLAPDFTIQIINILPRKGPGEKMKILMSRPSNIILQRHRHLQIQRLPVPEETNESVV